MPAVYPYKIMAWYPHMGAQDAAIWSRFIAQYPDLFEKVWYDLPVGSGAPIPDGTAPHMERDWQILTKYKCDVVAFDDVGPTIIEIKPRAGLGSIGQIIGYDLLYQEYVDKKARPNLVIVTDSLRSDMDWLADEFNIKVIVV